MGDIKRRYSFERFAFAKTRLDTCGVFSPFPTSVFLMCVLLLGAISRPGFKEIVDTASHWSTSQLRIKTMHAQKTVTSIDKDRHR